VVTNNAETDICPHSDCDCFTLSYGVQFPSLEYGDEYATNIKISESDPNKYNRIVPVVVFPNETVKLTLSCVNINFNGDENANAKWTVDLDFEILNDDKVEITETNGSKTAVWSRKFLIRELDKGVQTVYCQYDDEETRYPSIRVQFEVYVKEGEGEDDTTWTFGQGTTKEPREEVAENIKAQLEKKYGEGKVSQQRGNKFTVPASPSPPSPTPPDDGLSGGLIAAIAGIVVGCLAILGGIVAAIRAVLTGNCGWFSQKYSDYVQASPGDEESFWGCFAKNSDSGSEVKMDNLMKTDK